MPNYPDVPSLSDFDTEAPEGAWPVAWYRGKFLPSWTSERTGQTFDSRDEESKDGGSRNVRLLVQVTRPSSDEARVVFENVNYRVEDFDPARLAYLASMRKNKQADKDTRRSIISLETLRQLEKLTGKPFSLNGAGGLDIEELFGVETDVRLGIDARSGFNKVNYFAPAGTKVK